MKMTRFYVACVIAAVLSIGTFLVLDTMYPFKPEEIKVGETAELKDVLGGSLSPAEPEGAPTKVGTTEEMKAPAETSAAEPAAEEAAPAAEEPAGEELALADSPAEAPAEAAPAEAPAPVAAAEPEPEPAPAKPAPAPAKPKAAAKPAAPKASAPAASAKGKTGTGIQQWWTGDIEGQLSLVYAGSAAYKQAIVLLFNGAFDNTDSVNKNVSVKDGSGKIGGSWEISANNKRMVIFQVPRSGRYQITVNRGVKDRSGQVLAKTLQGPVYVQ